jgi:hypothetical protein
MDATRWQLQSSGLEPKEFCLDETPCRILGFLNPRRVPSGGTSFAGVAGMEPFL